MNLSNKRILLLAPVGQYSEAITRALEAMGAIVDCFEERPALNTAAKTLLRYYPRLIRSYTEAYFDRILKVTECNSYDFVLVIRGEAITRKFLYGLRGRHRDARVVLYQWDPMTLTKGPIDKLDLFDQCFSFDKYDCSRFPITLLPLFYIDDYKDIKLPAAKAEYDFSFIGTVHSDRYAILRQIEKYARLHSMITYFYMYLPSPVVFYKLKYIDKNLRGAAKDDFSFLPLSRSSTVEAVANSRIVVDSEHPAQRGLTMRTIEALGARRKLITTNSDIVNYDFYHPNNILVVDRNRIEIPDSFIRAEYAEIDRGIYESYSVHQWVSAIVRSGSRWVANSDQPGEPEHVYAH